MNDRVTCREGTLSREAFRRWCDDPPPGRYERIDGLIVAME